MAITARITISPISKKKYQAVISTSDGNVKTVHFGSSKHSDFTKHKDEKRKANYLKRHAPNEDWTINGIDTAGFWARWILWNQPSLRRSIQDLNRRFYKHIKVNLF
ncbi:MAG: hypothetical protein CML57_11020 [Rhodobacteraceae bacterium]|nr:hypothetical protein [Paracoccaceae bacterium]